MPRQKLKNFTSPQRRALKEALSGIVESVGSQQKLAEIISVSQTQVSYLINGINRLSPANAKLLAKIFGVPKETLRPDIYE